MAGVADTEEPTRKECVGLLKSKVVDWIAELSTFLEFWMSPPWEVHKSPVGAVGMGVATGLGTGGRFVGDLAGWEDDDAPGFKVGEREGFSVSSIS